MSIVDQKYWDDSYSNIAIYKESEEDPIVQIIRKYIPLSKYNESAFELGCFPGRYLSILGELGYTLNGIDTAERVNDLAEAFINMGYKVGNFYHKDYNTIVHEPKFHVVASFGFIEHFNNWKEIITQQSMQVIPNGYLIITTPNFRGLIQFLYHKLLDRRNLKRHIVSSMNPNIWAKILINQNFEIIDKGYVGTEFWDENYRKRRLARVVSKFLIGLAHIVNKSNKFSRLTNSYIYIIAKKKQ